jgi:hypothetical protein
MDYKNIVYAQLDYKFDRALFIKEYDEFIYPGSRHIFNNTMTWEKTRNLNRIWNMVDEETYDKCSIEIAFNRPLDRGIQSWKMKQLMYLVTHDQDPESVRRMSHIGGTFMRNINLDRTWLLKPEFENLAIVRYIQTVLPFKKIVSMHCVSLEPGEFASIHRDARWDPNIGRPSVIDKNGVRRSGYVIIVLNISDGGVPLYWALDGQDVNNVIKTNDDAYITSDYFLHGVPVCTSRRRQIRVTGIPSDELAAHINHNQTIEIPDDYVFDDSDHRYPG